MMGKSLLIVLFVIFVISSCSTHKVKHSPITNEGRYSIQQDLAPNTSEFDVSSLKQWHIQAEEKSRYGNHSPYIVFGKTYHLVDTKLNFSQTGTASWYGKKFHGHRTSNMEVFDMYKLTAAHRTLPLPSYVEVTNLENQKKIIVRVNDRGPFKSKRIIDLSWAAAKALDYDKKGLANVHIKLVQAPGMPSTELVQNQEDVQSNAQSDTQLAMQPPLASEKLTELKFLQVGAFSKEQTALEVASQLSQLILLPVHVTDTLAQNRLFRVRIGPLTEDVNIIDIIQKIHNKGFLNTKMVVE